jgi:DNA-3-methyladenine glycosylase I
VVFDGFDPTRVVNYGEDKVASLLEDAGIVRNRLKIRSAITNARSFLETQEEHGSFASYLWSWVDGVPVVNQPRTMAEVPARTDLSDQLSKDLKRRGFGFVGSTIIYALVQSAGVVDDHLVTCPQKRPATT